VQKTNLQPPNQLHAARGTCLKWHLRRLINLPKLAKLPSVYGTILLLQIHITQVLIYAVLFVKLVREVRHFYYEVPRVHPWATTQEFQVWQLIQIPECDVVFLGEQLTWILKYSIFFDNARDLKGGRICFSDHIVQPNSDPWAPRRNGISSPHQDSSYINLFSSLDLY
jgi:hypothetical protein